MGSSLKTHQQWYRHREEIQLVRKIEPCWFFDRSSVEKTPYISGGCFNPHTQTFVAVTFPLAGDMHQADRKEVNHATLNAPLWNKHQME